MTLEAGNFEKAMIANAVFGGEAYTPAETFTLKLFSDTVSLDGDGTEIDAAGYTATEIENDNTNFAHTTSGAKVNAVAITTSTLTEDSDEVVSAGLFDEDGELRYREVFDTPFVIEDGQYYNLAPGDLTFSVS